LTSTIGNTRILDSLGSASYQFDTSGRIDGGVDTTAELGVVEVSIQDGDTSITRQVTLGNQSDARSFSDFASDLQAAVNSAFAGDGYSVSASFSGGSLSISLDQTGAKTMSLSGAIIQDAFGSDVTASGRDAGAVLEDMSAVVAAINEDFDSAGLGARASFDSDTNTLVFEATTGPVGTASTIALTGSDLSELQFGDNTSASGYAGNATHVTIAEINIGSVAGAESAIASIDNAITFINAQRAELGAIENRLDHTINNLSSVVVNTEASKSRIADADFAVETGALTKAQVLSQAATAMLAQANASKQSVLSLLQ
jgi:flagellin